MDIITLIDELVTGLLKGAEDFYSSPKDFYSFESYVKTTTDATAAKFMSGILSDMDKTVADSTWRKNRYNIERKDHRTLVSSVLSDRLSSRPKGWSQTGADRMSKLRCYERNYGREKIIDLVRYSRQQRKLKSTGTVPKEIVELSAADFMHDKYSQAKSYIERIQATIPGITARKQSGIVFGMRLI